MINQPNSDERQRDADRSKNSILRASRDEFSEYGFGGARVDRIAQRSELNKRLIYYYFGDKEKLFQAVLEQAYQDIRHQEQQLALLTPGVHPPRDVGNYAVTWDVSAKDVPIANVKTVRVTASWMEAGQQRKVEYVYYKADQI